MPGQQESAGAGQGEMVPIAGGTFAHLAVGDRTLQESSGLRGVVPLWQEGRHPAQA